MIRSASTAILLVVLGAAAAAAAPSDPPPPLRAAVHVHSTVSTGTLTLDQLAEEAERLGLDVVVLSDNLALRYEYGLGPLRGVLRRQVRLPSVVEYGIERYLQAIEDAQRRHPRVLLVPGVEVVPHYYWTGSLFTRDLTMHDAQKNLLVVGPTDPTAYAGLPGAGLPAAGRYGWPSILHLSPALLLLPAAWLWSRGRTPMAVLEGLAHRYHVLAFALAGLALVLLVNAWPYTDPMFGLYERRFGYQPAQLVIDAAAASGAVTVWSMPEARDFHRHDMGLLGTVTVQTERYPEALILTDRYTAFGGLYEDTRTTIEPGGVWDQAIALYLAGERRHLPVLTGESAFHGPGEDDKELDRVVTVLEATDRTVLGVLEAFRRGRLHAVERYRPGRWLQLDRFEVQIEGGRRAARSGQVLDPEGEAGIRVAARGSSSDGGAYPVTVTLVRSGRVVASSETRTPFVLEFADVPPPAGVRHAYRLMVQGREIGELLSNPIIVGSGRTEEA